MSLREDVAATTVESQPSGDRGSRNDYARADVPALIRGMYSYHTRNLGWSDLAYNFLVDRFGRVWEGRAGGVARRVRGAHTLGFNATSAGIAVIGNFDIGSPGRRTTDAVARIAAWKLSRWSGAHSAKPGWSQKVATGSPWVER